MKKSHDFVLYYSDLWLKEWQMQTKQFTKPTREQIDNIINKNKKL